jgi:hypothetical protein
VDGDTGWKPVDRDTGQVRRVFKPQPFKARRGSDRKPSCSPMRGPIPGFGGPTPRLFTACAQPWLSTAPRRMSGKRSFGFREWRREGTQFTLNGVVWHLWG